MKTASIAIALLIAFSGPLAASGDKELLRGLKSVAVQIAPIGRSDEAAGIVPSQLRADVETQLRRFGIQVTDQPDALMTVSVVTSEHRAGELWYAVLLDVTENATLYRTGKLMNVTTWTTNMAVRMATVSAAGPVIRDAVREGVDEFITDFLAVNPVTTGIK
jgi:hypothetical protein